MEGRIEPQEFVAPNFRQRLLLFDSLQRFQHSSSKQSLSQQTITATRVYSAGSGYYGQLGLPSSKKMCRHDPVEVELEQPPFLVSAGGCHSMVLSENGSLYSFGDGRSGQLGCIPRRIYLLSSPTPIDSLTANKVVIQSVSCGQSHTIAVSTSGNVYCWGSGKCGQLGFGSRMDEVCSFLFSFSRLTFPGTSFL